MEQLVLENLHALYFHPDAAQKKKANTWLQDFQLTDDAWRIADWLLLDKDAPSRGIEPQLFGAQTIRAKCRNPLDQSIHEPLRLTLTGMLLSAPNQSRFVPAIDHYDNAGAYKAVRTQLCLSLVSLALNTAEWQDPVGDWFHLFDQRQLHPLVLLELLCVLPEEVRATNDNPGLSACTVTDRIRVLLASNSQRVLAFLACFFQQETSSALKGLAFECLIAWIRSNDISGAQLELSGTPFVATAFQSLQSVELFDTASEFICELIRESVVEYEGLLTPKTPLVTEILQHMCQLKPMLIKCKKQDEEDEGIIDEQRGYTRMFVEAGEIYLPLFANDIQPFIPIIESILICTSFSDLDIVPITFNFWYELTKWVDESRLQKPGVEASISPLYMSLLEVMVRHLRYPDDMNTMTAEERDNFRDFRHVMGDVLKDCCVVLGDSQALAHPYSLLVQSVSNLTSFVWQDIEAPLFSLRTMGAEVSSNEETIFPQVMELLPKLPSHPKIRYAATLTIGRYADWTKFHPQYIPSQLQYISVGFDVPEVSAASALALKFLCESCGPLMVGYLPQLTPFYVASLDKLKNRDIHELTEAIAHIINALPPDGITQPLQSFCLPIAQRLHEISQSPLPASSVSEEIHSICQHSFILLIILDLCDRFSIFMKRVNPKLQPGQDHPTFHIFQSMLPVFEKLLVQYGTSGAIVETICKIFKGTVIGLGDRLLPLLPKFCAILINSFRVTQQSSLLWIGSYVVRVYSKFTPNNAELFSLITAMCHEMIAVTFNLVKSSDDLERNPDLVDDFLRLCNECILHLPQFTYAPSELPNMVQFGLLGLTSHRPEVLENVVLFLRELFYSLVIPQSDKHLLSDEMRLHGIQILQQSMPLIITNLMQAVLGIGRNSIDAFIYTPLSSLILAISTTCGSDATLNILRSQVDLYQCSDQTEKYSDIVKMQFLESCKSCFESGKAERLRNALATLSSAYRGRTRTTRGSVVRPPNFQ